MHIAMCMHHQHWGVKCRAMSDLADEVKDLRSGVHDASLSTLPLHTWGNSGLDAGHSDKCISVAGLHKIGWATFACYHASTPTWIPLAVQHTSARPILHLDDAASKVQIVDAMMHAAQAAVAGQITAASALFDSSLWSWAKRSEGIALQKAMQASTFQLGHCCSCRILC